MRSYGHDGAKNPFCVPYDFGDLDGDWIVELIEALLRILRRLRRWWCGFGLATRVGYAV